MSLRSPGYWRARAEEARTSADNMRDEDARGSMLGVADTYETLAQASQRFADRFGVPSEGWSDDKP
jgi:hypothetical protein